MALSRVSRELFPVFSFWNLAADRGMSVSCGTSSGGFYRTGATTGASLATVATTRVNTGPGHWSDRWGLKVPGWYWWCSWQSSSISRLERGRGATSHTTAVIRRTANINIYIDTSSSYYIINLNNLKKSYFKSWSQWMINALASWLTNYASLCCWTHYGVFSTISPSSQTRVQSVQHAWVLPPGTNQLL